MKFPGMKDIWGLIKDSGIAWDRDNIWRLGAALAYFTVFSLSPLLILVIVLSSLGFGQDAARGHLVSQIRGLIGIDGAKFIQTMLENAYESGASIPAAIFGIVTLLLGATGVFVQLRESLNTIWCVQETSLGIMSYLRARLLSFTMIIGLGFLLLVSLILSALLSAISGYLSSSFAILSSVVSLMDFLISFVGITVLFALIFKFLPDAIVEWADVWIGAAVTSLLFSIGKIAIGFYLGNSVIGSTFGAASSLVIIMLWAFYSSQIILFGAEFTRIYSERFGTQIRPAHNAVRIVTRKVDIETGLQKQRHAHAKTSKQ
ncbi:MAG: YihY/virulence factor BrkB family protein [bacterium]